MAHRVDAVLLNPTARNQRLIQVYHNHQELGGGLVVQGRDIYTTAQGAAICPRTSSSRALRSPSVGPFDPRAAGSLLIIPSTSFTIFTTISTVVAAVEVPVTAGSDEGACVEPSPAAGLMARFVLVSSADQISREDKQRWEVNEWVSEVSFVQRGIIPSPGGVLPSLEKRARGSNGSAVGRDRADLNGPNS